MENTTGKVFIIGGRRGFGKAIAEQWRVSNPLDIVFTTSRRPEADFICDLSQEKNVEELLLVLGREKPQRVFCIAGGGPYGEFTQKKWTDHKWALEVSFLAPLRIAHFCLQQDWSEQLIFVGSNIAESSADPKAASYSAAKHGLLGFVKTAVMESSKDLRLFSPSYMATDMLPPNAAVLNGKSVADPSIVAKNFVKWACEPKGAWHNTYTS